MSTNPNYLDFPLESVSSSFSFDFDENLHQPELYPADVQKLNQLAMAIVKYCQKGQPLRARLAHRRLVEHLLDELFPVCLEDIPFTFEYNELLAKQADNQPLHTLFFVHPNSRQIAVDSLLLERSWLDQQELSQIRMNLPATLEALCPTRFLH